jgi:hypothetical protein
MEGKSSKATGKDILYTHVHTSACIYPGTAFIIQ